MSKYAEKTTVSPEKTLAEIQCLLIKYGANKFMYAQEENRVGIGFCINNKSVRFVLPLPDKKDFQKRTDGTWRGERERENAYQQAIRQRWRALLLSIKAKLESVQSGIETIEEAFMAQIVMPNGQTMSEWAAPQIEDAYKSGKMPPLLGNVH